ncbi:hypothetical protein LTR36_001957 [Oleoguttula mirabilis]|uniref:Enhancer of mRNA-decapping protein 3 n=1 Tax=Oleoguttula mirabilis TaxID=1507867 RepID=A0AAV9JMV4_9PEZI|nr:hypothetical protein LTR36_001957 [Oleoguttula mirabilis]
MADFTGMTVQVTLRQPPNTVLHGRVKEVIAGQTLTLEDVIFPSTGTRWQHWTVQGTAIADLQVIEAKPASTPTSAIRSNAPSLPIPSAPIAQPVAPTPLHTQQASTGQSPPQRQPSSFVDPAILSYGVSPVQTKIPQQAPVEAPAIPARSMLAKAAESLPANGSPFVAEAGNGKDSRKASRTRETIAPPVQEKSAAQRDSALQKQKEHEELEQGGQGDIGAKKKVRRGQRKKGGSTPVASSDPPPVMNVEVSRNGNDMDSSSKRGKGWRQTPLLQPSPQTTSPANMSGTKKQTRKQRENDKEMQQNGWATEDATDVQDLGDFDFEASNKLFDKKGVFDELRQGDTTADEDRLVSHNRVSRPGTYGGKNLHPTENVLSPKLAPKYNSNEVDSASDTDTQLNLATGRSSSKVSTTRVTIGKKQPGRQNSTQLEGKPHPLPLTASVSSDRAGINRAANGRSISKHSATRVALGRKQASRQSSTLVDGKHNPHPLTASVSSLAGRNGKDVPSVATSSPRLDGAQSPEYAISPHFVIQQTLSMCPVLHPSALVALEAATVTRYGLTHDSITESAARCVAELAMSLFDPFSGSRRGSRANTLRGSMTSSMLADRSQPPVIVILAGNDALGARAVAAARHLVARHCQIIVAEALFESSETQDAQMRTQTAMLRRMQRGGASIKRGPWRKALNYIKNLTGPPAVIIDALLAGSTYESLLEANAQHAAESQKEAHEMIDWANRSRAPVLSVGCPSGVSGVDGSATVVEGEPLAIRPDRVICLAAPMQGVLEANKNGETWEMSVADIGINIALLSEESVAFGSHWVAELRYVEEDLAVDE